MGEAASPQSGPSRLVRGSIPTLAVMAAVVVIISMMIIKFEPWVMDVLIGLNLTLAASVLLVAITIPDAKKLPSFPTILLLATLFRLGLNVATTRLILLEANAGEIIFAFGDFVVGGNFVVGAVVFLVLVLIQFIVIAKGSERVAEVSARFTLDAMPGKQSSIDMELRSESITREEAKAKREDLERESKLYGAMDGAMKFVKGDAIAGIIISLVNIIGGLIIGITQQNMSAGEAAEVYSLLTIGDGLVSQIPALLISVSAGLVVTRVAASESEESNLGRDIFTQIFSRPLPMVMTTVLLLMFAMLPGFPTPVFIVLAAIIGVLAYAAHARSRSLAQAEKASSGKDAEQPPQAVPSAPPAVSVEIGPEHEPLFFNEGPDGFVVTEHMRERLRGIREDLENEFGISVPPIVITWGSGTLRGGAYVIYIHEAPVSTGEIAADQSILECSAEEAKAFGLEASPYPVSWLPWTSPSNPHRYCMIQTNDVAAVQPGDGFPTSSSCETWILKHVRSVVTCHLASFVGIQEVSNRLEQIQRPDLVDELKKSMTVQQITEGIQLLLDEQVSVADFASVLNAFAKWSSRLQLEALRQGHSVLPADFVTSVVDQARIDMRQRICAAIAPRNCALNYAEVGGSVAEVLRNRQKGSSGGAARLPSPQVLRDILEAAPRSLQPQRTQHRPVLITEPDVRRPLRELLKIQFPHVAVLSTQEIRDCFLGPAASAAPPLELAVVNDFDEEPRAPHDAEATPPIL